MKKVKGINTFTDLYERFHIEGGLMSDFILGHLVIEFLLIKIIEIGQPKLLKLAEELNHRKLIELVYGLKFISKNQRDVLILINNMRNKFAHDITYTPTIEELKFLSKKACSAFDDSTDAISQGLEELENISLPNECGGWLIPQLCIEISFDLHEIYQNLGGHMENF